MLKKVEVFSKGNIFEDCVDGRDPFFELRFFDSVR